MPGVFVCPPTEEAIAAALRDSARSWTGPIVDPPILAHTPDALADDVVAAVRVACEGVRGDRESLLWLANIPTPYRVAMWSRLARRTSLRVVSLAHREPNRDWREPMAIEGARLDLLDTPAIRSGTSTPVYLPSVSLFRVLLTTTAKAVVLGGWESPAFLTAAMVARMRGIAVVAAYNSTLLSHRFRVGPVAWVRGWFFRRADAVLTAGPAATEAVLAMGVPSSRVVTGFNAVDVAFFHDGAVAARAGGGAAAGHHVLYVGQLIERKNVGAALRAWVAMRGEQDTFTVVGSGPLRAALERLAVELGVAERVRFLGHLDGAALVEEYGRAHTFVLPSTEEVWGLVVNEALAAGLHVVVSSAAGVARSVEAMPGVFVCPPTEEAIAAALRDSARSWTGPIVDPPILAHTPDAYADSVIEAVGRAERRRQRA
jgi:glycosyltransferase involved in cell wall biosynthesis